MPPRSICFSASSFAVDTSFAEHSTQRNGHTLRPTAFVRAPGGKQRHAAHFLLYVLPKGAHVTLWGLSGGMGQAVREKGIKGTELPPSSPLCITVPGSAALWEDLLKEQGSKSMQEVHANTPSA